MKGVPYSERYNMTNNIDSKKTHKSIPKVKVTELTIDMIASSAGINKKIS